MKKIIIVLNLVITILILKQFSAYAAGSASPRTLAVLYFENNSLYDREKLDPLRKGLADMFITELSKVSAFKVVERAQLQQILEEMKLGQSGMLDARTAVQVGKLLGAQHLVFGSFMQLNKKQIRIDIRIVDVETGLTIKAEQESGKPKDLYKLVAKLVAKLLKNLDVRVSRAEAMRLSAVENTSFDAALYYARGLEYEDAGKPQKAIEMYKKALKKSPGYESARRRLVALGAM